MNNPCDGDKLIYLSFQTHRVRGYQDLNHGELELPGGLHRCTLGVRFEAINLEAQQGAISVESSDHAHVSVPFIDESLQRNFFSSGITRGQGWWQKSRTSIHDCDLLIRLDFSSPRTCQGRRPGIGQKGFHELGGIMLHAIIPVGDPLTPTFKITNVDPRRATSAQVHQKSGCPTKI